MIFRVREELEENSSTFHITQKHLPLPNQFLSLEQRIQLFDKIGLAIKEEFGMREVVVSYVDHLDFVWLNVYPT